MKELIVVAAHGPDFAQQCVESLPVTAEVLVVDTGSYVVPNADVQLNGGHPTAAYRWAYENTDADRFLFIQDSMTAVVADPVSWFRDAFSAGGDAGAAAWGLFGLAFDTPDQQAWVEQQYPGATPPTVGIMGPIFYTSRDSLDVLSGANLLPRIPQTRLQAQGTERAWAYAFHCAGLPLLGVGWDYGQMQIGFGPFKKVWAGRP